MVCVTWCYLRGTVDAVLRTASARIRGRALVTTEGAHGGSMHPVTSLAIQKSQAAPRIPVTLRGSCMKVHRLRHRYQPPGHQEVEQCCVGTVQG